MGKILALSENVIGKIAAGEVVERPAAAIKELTENSLDAGAKAITVEIRQDPTDYIRVTDNGCGIDPSDLKMAFERHATSKIRKEDDLNAIATLGFRGEALASIAAVGRVTLNTRTAEAESGVSVRNEGGQILGIEDAACPTGTTIIVRDLFFNTPVRRNFLKKPAAEAGAIIDLIAHLILSRPDVSFRLISGGKQIYHSPGDGRLASAIHAVFGSAALKQMRPVEGHMNGVLLSGYVGIGELARSNRNGEFFFINRRMMRSGALSAALENACRERVMIGRFPMAVLRLEVPYETVNVNVHPNKLEVRFQHEAAVCEAVETIVREALQDRDAFEKPVEMQLTKPGTQAPAPTDTVLRESLRTLREQPVVTVTESSRLPETAVLQAPDGSGMPGETGSLSAAPVRIPQEGAHAAMRAFIPPGRQGTQTEACGTEDSRDRPNATAEQARNPQELLSAMTPAATAGGPRITGAGSLNKEPAVNPVSWAEQAGVENALASRPEEQKSTVGMPPIGTPLVTAEEGQQAVAEKPATGTLLSTVEEGEQLSAEIPEMAKPIKIFGALFDTFILIEYEDHLLLVDQHAVHERLLFDQLMASFGKERLGQEMLVPVSMPVTRNEMRLLEENRELLESFGMTVEPFGETDVAIRTMPVILGDVQPADFLRDVISELEAGRQPSFEKRRAALLQTACKHAVKGGEKLDEGQLRHLVEQMIEQKVTPTCPHGRPLVVSISHRELDKKFKRIQE